MSSSSTKIEKNTALLVLARSLADELRHIHYPQEWAQEPLSSLLPLLYKVLNIHPGELGTIIKEAFGKTVPKPETGNINQLEALYPDYFSKNRQYYKDMYTTQMIHVSTQGFGIDLSGSPAKTEHNNDRLLLSDLAHAVIGTFATLNIDQENAHRTLERLSFSMTPVYYAYGLQGIGFDISEYADYWRKLSAEDRLKLRSEIIERW